MSPSWVSTKISGKNRATLPCLRYSGECPWARPVCIGLHSHASGREWTPRSVELGLTRMKIQRQAAIVELVGRERISSQELLRQWLLAQGFDVTQATLSRDIKEIGLVKRAADGVYQRPDAEGARPQAAETLRRTTREFLRILRAGAEPDRAQDRPGSRANRSPSTSTVPAARSGGHDRRRRHDSGRRARRRGRRGLAARFRSGRSSGRVFSLRSTVFRPCAGLRPACGAAEGCRRG